MLSGQAPAVNRPRLLRIFILAVDAVWDDIVLPGYIEELGFAEYSGHVRHQTI
jgi:hypothetical protein